MARLPLALGESAVVVHQTGEPCSLEDARVVIQPHAPNRREPVRHHDERMRALAPLRQVQPAGQLYAPRVELHIASHARIHF